METGLFEMLLKQVVSIAWLHKWKLMAYVLITKLHVSIYFFRQHCRIMFELFEGNAVRALKTLHSHKCIH